MTTQHFLLTGWHWDPFSIAVCCGVALLLLKAHRSEQGASGSTAAAGTGWIVLVLALLSPVATLARQYLFSAHMLQHILLLLAVPPLLLLSLPLQRTGEQRLFTRLSRFLRATPAGWLAGVGAMWVWHARALCDAAASRTGVYYFQIASLLALGTLFWWPIVGPRETDRLPALGGIAYLVSACFACTLLGIYITFAPASLCPAFMHPSDRLGLFSLIRNDWGLTPETDQAVGGLMMWVPACLIYLGGVIGILTRWYASAGHTSGDAAPAAGASQ